MNIDQLDGVSSTIKEYIGGDVLEGWLTQERALELAQLVVERDIQTAVCLGVFGGRSIMAIGLAMQYKRSGKVFGIDPWKIEDALEGENEANQKWWSEVDLNEMHTLTMEMIWKHKLDDFAIIIRAASQRVPKLFAGGIQLLEIDGNHSEVASCRDVELYLPQVQAGGIVLMDDCDWPSTKKAQDMVAEHCNVLKSGDGGHYTIFIRR